MSGFKTLRAGPIMFFHDPSKILNLKSKRIKRPHLYAGTTKTLFSDMYDDTLILCFNDTCLPSQHERSIAYQKAANASAEKMVVPGKGIINNRISELFFVRLADINVANHFVDRLNMREQRIKAASPLPFKVTVHNIARGDFAKRMNLTDNLFLQIPVIEFSHKLHDGSSSILSEQHIESFNLASKEEIADIYEISNRVNDFMRGQCLSVGLQLDYFSLEFGQYFTGDFFEAEPTLILIDELSPDTMHFTDIESQKILYGASNDKAVYEEIANRFQVLKNGGPVDLKQKKD